MKPDDQDIQWVEEPELGLAGKIVSAAVRPGADHHAPAPASAAR